MRHHTNLLSLTALAVLVALAGCNVFESAYEEGGSVDNAVEDAQHARASGDYDRAEQLLRGALEDEPDNRVVRVELSSTLLQREQINLASIEQVTSHLLDELGHELPESPRTAGRGGSVMADSCTWNSTEPTRPLDPLSIEGIGEVIEAYPVILEVSEFLNGAQPGDASVIPAVISDLDPCEAIVDGQIAYDRDALLAELRTQLDDDNRRVNAALTMNAISQTMIAYLDLFEFSPFEIDWFVVGAEEDTRLGFCLDETEVDPFYDAAVDQVDRVAQATFSLDLLIHNSGDEEMQDLVEEAIDLYVEFEESLGQFCGE